MGNFVKSNIFAGVIGFIAGGPSGALIAIGLNTAQYLFAPKPEGYDREAIESNVVSAVGPVRYPIGETLVGGDIVFAATGEVPEFFPGTTSNVFTKALTQAQQQREDNTLYVVYYVGEGPLESLRWITIEGHVHYLFKVTDELARVGADGMPTDYNLASFGEYITDSNSHYRNGISITPVFKADGTGWDTLTNALPGRWTTAHKGTGSSFIIVRFFQPDDEQIWTTSGVPQMQFVVHGMKFTWPGQTTPKWSNSAAVVWYWFEKTFKERADADFDIPSFNAAFSLSHQNVTVTLTQAYVDAGYSPTFGKYEFNGMILSTDDIEDIEAQFRFSALGHVIEVSDKLEFRFGAAKAAVKTMLESELIIGEGEVRKIVPQDPLEERVNAITMSLAQSTRDNFAEHDLLELEYTAGITRDGRKYSKDYGQLRFEINPIRAEWKRTVEMRKALHSTTLTLAYYPGDNFENCDLSVGDYVNVNLEEYGFVNLPCIITCLLYTSPSPRD